MANEKNLKPFQKGIDERRNLNGAPKKIPDLDILLSEVLTQETNGIDAAKAILEALVKKAKLGDVRAAEIILDRAYGKAKQLINLSGQMNVSLMNIDPLSDDQSNGMFLIPDNTIKTSYVE